MTPLTKPCRRADCGQLLTQRPGEQPCVFRDRDYCSDACRNAARAASARDQMGPDRSGMALTRAETWLRRIPPRLLPQFEELPRAEQERALRGWGWA